MKKIYLLLLLAVACASCEDFLREEPKHSVAPEAFYKTDEEAQAGARGVYCNLAGTYACNDLNRNLSAWLHYGTDIVMPTGGRGASLPFHIYTLSVATEGDVPALWRRLYRGVVDACNLVDQVSAATTISPTMKQQIVAEAKLYRAMYYYNLTGLWGDVPFFDKYDMQYIISGLPRTNVSGIRNKMIQDLEENADFLPETSADDYKGRPTRWAAKALLCKYYAWEKQWGKLSALCEDIIEHSPHELVGEYANLWGLENEYNSEFIWEFDFEKEIFFQNVTTSMFPRGVDENASTSDKELKKAFIGWGMLTSANEFINSFDAADKRRIWYKWLDGDSRVDFMHNYVAKFLDDPSVAQRDKSGINIPVFRLADIYLMQAEAENELNNAPSTKAYERINKIRERAGLSPLEHRTKEQFLQDIMNERKWELGFEFHRKLDLCRWNKLVEVVQTMTESNPQGASLVQPHHQLFPIPLKELDKNPNLVQNPGY